MLQQNEASGRRDEGREPSGRGRWRLPSILVAIAAMAVITATISACEDLKYDRSSGRFSVPLDGRGSNR